MFNLMRKGYSDIRTIFLAYNLLQKRFIGHLDASSAQTRNVTDEKLESHTDNGDLVSWTKKIAAYSNEGKIDLSRAFFDEMPVRDSVAYNVMIREYVRHGRINDARILFDEMSERNTITWNSMIMAYARERNWHTALKLFVVMPEDYKDIVSWTTIISGFSRGSRIADSWLLFKQFCCPDSACWSSVISGFQQNGLPTEALICFREMLSVGKRPTSYSFTSVLTAAADLAALSVGMQLYCQLMKRGFNGNTHVGNSTISMFLKSGSLHCAKSMFNSMPQKDIFSWNAMITGYGQHGYGLESIQFLHQMHNAGFQPDRVSFLGVLQGCSHSGYVKEGIHYFHRMQKDFRVPWECEHYHSMVDVLARAGFLREATMMILKMPFMPSAIFWRTLLNGCRIFGDFVLGAYAADHVLELDSHNGAACLMIMDMYKAVGRITEAAKMRRWMFKEDARRELAHSWIEIKGRAHLFTTRDETHEESGTIYKVNELLADAIAEYVE